MEGNDCSLVAGENGTLLSTEHRVQVSVETSQEGGGKDTRRPGETKSTCTAQAGTEGSLFWQRRGKDVAELSFSLKTCRPKIVGEEEKRRQTPTITGIVLPGQNASDDDKK